MQFPISFGLRRSRFLGAALLVMTLGATAALWAWPRSTAISGLFSLLCWSVCALGWRHLTPSLAALRIDRDGSLHARLASNPKEWSRVTLLPDATVHPWLTVVRVADVNGRRQTVVLSPDVLSPDDFRRLRVFLRWRADFSGRGDA